MSYIKLCSRVIACVWVMETIYVHMYNCTAHNNDTLNNHFMIHLSILFRKVHDEITICFNWVFIDNLLFLISHGWFELGDCILYTEYHKCS